MQEDKDARIESKDEVTSYIQSLRYALSSGAQVLYVPERKVDQDRDIRHTNRYTLNNLFPDRNPVIVLKQELAKLEVRDYICTIQDSRYPNASELRVFGKRYESDNVYIKIRVDLVDKFGGKSILVLSFHYAEYELNDNDFPYK